MSSNPRHFILATAGHVDHGKSALIKALTGTDPDRLPEEKARGITIDLGFAHLELPSPAGPDGEATSFSVGIVDVPGHEDFVKNMVAGVGSVDLALLIVAADDGWMPQTEEHLQILTYLGIRRGVVALTKIDLAETARPELEKRVREKLAGTPLANAPVVPTSVNSGEGIPELRTTLASVLAETPPTRDLEKPRLAIDRSFTLRGMGTIVTGTLAGGCLRRGQQVIVQPRGKVVRVRSLQQHNREVGASPPGTRTAVNLTDIAVRTASDTAGVGRGDLVTIEALGQAHATLDVLLERSSRGRAVSKATARPLKHGARVHVHHGAANVPARLLLRQGRELPTGQNGLAELRLDRPVVALAGDRLIVRDWSEQCTLAGVVVLDPEAERRHWRNAAQARFLEGCVGALSDARHWIPLRLARDRVAPASRLHPRSPFAKGEFEAACARLVEADRVVVLGDLLADRGWWSAMTRRAADLIDACHRDHPERPGLSVRDLRARLTAELPVPSLMEPLIQYLARAGFEQSGSLLRSRSHRLTLPPHLKPAGDRIRGALMRNPMEPPSRKEIETDANARDALRFLLDSGDAVEVSAELAMSAAGYNRAVRLVKLHLREHRRATVSDLRKALGTSRRIMVPLLEKLDREGLTRREGDCRVPGGPSAAP